MKKCYHFPTWKEQKDVMISLEESRIDIYSKIPHEKYIKQSTPSDPILAKLCELTGAKMYGDYVVLDTRFIPYRKKTLMIGDIFASGRLYDNSINDKHPFGEYKYGIQYVNYEKIINTTIEGDYYMEFNCNRVEDLNEDIFNYTNIFQEYSKFLRKKKNKWEEVKKIVL